MTTPERFAGFVAIDWSGARGARHKGIAVARCGIGTAAPELVAPSHGGAWSRTEVLDWLLAHARERWLVGFDFSFSAPYVARGAFLPGEPAGDSARALWAWVDAHSDDVDLGAAGFLEARRGRHFYLGAADGAKADFLHWRVCEVPPGGGRKPSTVFDAIGAAQVAKASFAGMRLLHGLEGRVAIWPFDPLPAQGMVVAEIYTAIAARAAGMRAGRSKLRSPEALDAALAALCSGAHGPLARFDDHATDAVLAAAWLRHAAADPALWTPARLTPAIARTEGWTLGAA